MVYDMCENTERCRRRSNVSGGVGFGVLMIFLFPLVGRRVFALSLVFIACVVNTKKALTDPAYALCSNSLQYTQVRS